MSFVRLVKAACFVSGGSVTIARGRWIDMTDGVDGAEVNSLNDHIAEVENAIQWLHDHRASLHFKPHQVSLIAQFGTHTYGGQGEHLLDAIEKAQAHADSRL